MLINFTLEPPLLYTSSVFDTNTIDCPHLLPHVFDNYGTLFVCVSWSNVNVTLDYLTEVTFRLEKSILFVYNFMHLNSPQKGNTNLVSECSVFIGHSRRQISDFFVGVVRNILLQIYDQHKISEETSHMEHPALGWQRLYSSATVSLSHKGYRQNQNSCPEKWRMELILGYSD